MAESFAKKPAQRPTTCAADMKHLEAEFQDAETNIFAPGWREGRTAPPANALMTLDPAYAAGWCREVARTLGETARNNPSLIGLDRRSEQGRKQIDGLLRELTDIVLVMDDWEETSTWTRATKGKPLDYTFLSRLALDDYSTFYWPPFVGGDEADAAVLRLAGVKFYPDNQSETAKSPAELIRRLRLNVELGTCRAATLEAKSRLMDP